MNALERANLIDEMVEDIGEGIDYSIEGWLAKCGYRYDELDVHTKRAIEERFFTCDNCCYTLSKDQMDETEIGDGFLCKECADA